MPLPQLWPPSHILMMNCLLFHHHLGMARRCNKGLKFHQCLLLAECQTIVSLIPVWKRLFPVKTMFLQQLLRILVLHLLVLPTITCFTFLAGPSASEFNKKHRDQIKGSPPPIPQSSGRKKFIEGLWKCLVDVTDLGVSFEKFPYYLRYLLIVYH